MPSRGLNHRGQKTGVDRHVVVQEQNVVRPLLQRPLDADVHPARKPQVRRVPDDLDEAAELALEGRSLVRLRTVIYNDDPVCGVVSAAEAA